MASMPDDNGFPAGIRKLGSKEDRNPAILLFGRRFSADQPTLELLSELLLVTASTKRVGEDEVAGMLPELGQLRDWPAGAALGYEPKARLNLKLFAFLGSSRLETRHEAHRRHCERLWEALRARINVGAGNMDKDAFLRLLSSLLLGFWGNGADRTWCAQTFLPLCRSTLAAETIWNESNARRLLPLESCESWSAATVDPWEAVLDKFNELFSVSKHRFLARGGEMLYLHLCNGLRQEPTKVRAWLCGHAAGGATLDSLMSEEEKEPARLRQALEDGFKRLFRQTPPALDRLMEFIDTGVDDRTAQKSDRDSKGLARRVVCGWCPEESWREGYLLAVELKRILAARIDVVDAVDLLEVACALHVMRSLAAQSGRARSEEATDGFGWRVLVSAAEGASRRIRRLSRESLVHVCGQIHAALRIPAIKEGLDQERLESIYKEADDRYGRRLYLRMGKSIGLVVPRHGAGLRAVLTDRILRCLLLSMMPGRRMTVEALKRQIELHHGLVFEEEGLRAATEMAGRGSLLDSSEHAGDHLEQMLEEAGVLVRLSDSCSMVAHPFFGEEQA